MKTKRLLLFLFAVAFLSMLGSNAYAQWGDGSPRVGSTVKVSNDTELQRVAHDPYIGEAVLAGGFYSTLNRKVQEGEALTFTSRNGGGTVKGPLTNPCQVGYYTLLNRCYDAGSTSLNLESFATAALVDPGPCPSPSPTGGWAIISALGPGGTITATTLSGNTNYVATVNNLQEGGYYVFEYTWADFSSLITSTFYIWGTPKIEAFADQGICTNNLTSTVISSTVNPFYDVVTLPYTTRTSNTSYAWSSTGGATFDNSASATPKFSGSTPAGTYTVTLTVTETILSNGVVPGHTCTKTSTKVVTVYDLPTVDAGNGGSIGNCSSPGSSFQIAATSTGNSFLWTGTGSAYLSSTTILSPIFSGAPVGTYTLTLTATNTITSCSQSDDVTIIVDALPTADAGAGTTMGVCGKTYQLAASVTGTPAYGFAWTGAGSGYLNSTVIEDPIFTSSVAGTYTLVLTVTDSYGCTASDNVTIVVDPAPTADAGLGSTMGVCTRVYNLNATATGTATLGFAWTGAGTSYLNSTSVEDPIFTSALAGTYTLVLTVTDNYGCTASDNVTIVVDPAPTADAGAGTIMGVCGKTYQLAATVTGTATLGFAWTGAGTSYLSSTAVEDPLFTSSVAGTYTLVLTVTDKYGCTASDNLTIVVDPAPTADAGAGTIMGVCGKTYQLAATVSGTATLLFAWTGDGSSYLSSTSIEDPLFTSSVAGTYTLVLTVTDTYGCTASDNVTIVVDPAPTADADAGTRMGVCGKKWREAREVVGDERRK